MGSNDNMFNIFCLQSLDTQSRILFLLPSFVSRIWHRTKSLCSIKAQITQWFPMILFSPPRTVLPFMLLLNFISVCWYFYQEYCGTISTFQVIRQRAAWLRVLWKSRGFSLASFTDSIIARIVSKLEPKTSDVAQ